MIRVSGRAHSTLKLYHTHNVTAHTLHQDKLEGARDPLARRASMSRQRSGRASVASIASAAAGKARRRTTDFQSAHTRALSIRHRSVSHLNGFVQSLVVELRHALFGWPSEASKDKAGASASASASAVMPLAKLQVP